MVIITASWTGEVDALLREKAFKAEQKRLRKRSLSGSGDGGSDAMEGYESDWNSDDLADMEGSP